MSVLIAHPTGNEFFRAAAKGFYKADVLHSLYTSVASFPGTFLYRMGSLKIFSDMRRRALDASFKNITHTHPWKEMGRLLAIKTGKKKLIQHETGIFCVDEIYKSLDKYVAKNLSKEQAQGVSAIYAYEDGAVYSFRKAKELNVKCLYDLPIGYWRSMLNMLSNEKELNPDWAMTLEGFKNSQEKLNRKEEEINLADTITVASRFTLQTLKNYPGKLPEVVIVPYGFPAVVNRKYQPFALTKKIKILFVGSLSQRKGLSYLFKAVEGFENQITLTIVGRCINYNCKPLITNLKKHIWIETLPHDKVLELMRQHDVLIFPSLFEGFGLVITEAMAQGTPVITTERTAGPDIIKHGENGWLVNAGCAEAIKKVLEQIILCPHLIAEIGTQALETAKKRPWHVYGDELAEAIKIKTG